MVVPDWEGGPPQPPEIKFKLLRGGAKLPRYAHEGDAGFDLLAFSYQRVDPGELVIVELGIASEIPPGYFVSVRDRSGLAARWGIHTLGGVIDSGYRGEWKVVLVNLGRRLFEVEAEMAVAQGILQPYAQARLTEVEALGESDRGEGGFGSTG